MTFVLAYGLISEPIRYPELVLVMLAVLTAATLSSNWIVWQLRGKEVLAVTNEGICVWREGALFKRRLFLRLDEVEFIRAEEDRDTPWWIRYQYGINGGSIVIGHNGRKRRWGIDLESERAVSLATAVRRAWEERLAVLR